MKEKDRDLSNDASTQGCPGRIDPPDRRPDERPAGRVSAWPASARPRSQASGRGPARWPPAAYTAPPTSAADTAPPTQCRRPGGAGGCGYGRFRKKLCDDSGESSVAVQGTPGGLPGETGNSGKHPPLTASMSRRCCAPAASQRQRWPRDAVPAATQGQRCCNRTPGNDINGPAMLLASRHRA